MWPILAYLGILWPIVAFDDVKHCRKKTLQNTARKTVQNARAHNVLFCSQNVPFFSQNVIFFSKCSTCSQNVPHYFLKFFPLFSQILPLFSQILPFFSQILQFFSQNVPVVSQNIFIPNKYQKKFKISWANPEGRGLLRAAEN